MATGGRESFRDLQNAQGPFPETVTSTTPTGGFHLHFAYPPGVQRMPCSAGKIAPGVDVRGDGGYVPGVAVIVGLYRIARRSADKGQEVVNIFRGIEGNLGVLLDVVDFEGKTIVHIGGDDQPDGIERVGEHFI